MKNAIEVLQQRQHIIREEIRQGVDRENNIVKIAKINKAIAWLSKIEGLDLKKASEYEIVELPYMQTGYSDFRIMNDCETDDRSLWIECIEHTILTAGDFIITKK